MSAPTTAAPLLAPAAPELEQLEAQVQARLHGLVRDLRLVGCGPGLILTGQAHTYYAKQLAQHAVMAATARPLLANEIQVGGAPG
jgi:hypothetical protein